MVDVSESVGSAKHVANAGMGPDHKSFPAFEQIYLLSYVQLADTKAAVFLAMTTGAIAYLAGHYGLAWLRLEDVGLHIVLLSLSTGFLGISAADAFAVIVPRLPRSATGILYFESVARLSGHQYANEVLRRSSSEIFNEQLDYCRDLARICAIKYKLLHRSLITGILGYAAFLAALILLSG